MSSTTDTTSPEDKLVSILSSMGNVGIALALAAVPVAVGIAIYITRMGTQAKIDGLKAEIDRLKATIDDNLAKAETQRTKLEDEHQAILAEANKKYAELDEKYRDILRRGAEIQAHRQEIVTVAEEIATQLDANDCAVLVPAPTLISGDKPNELVFLYASGPQAAILRRVRVPISEKSHAGAVYLSGETAVASPSASDNTFASRVDEITEYKTNEPLSVCFRYKSERVGVAQFLNKRNGQQFNLEDEQRAQDQCTALAPLVANFIADPRRLIELGHAPRRKQIDATIMLVDLSNYGVLFDELDSSVITDLLNEYFQELCTIALHHGGFIDQFVGDGVLLTFNVIRRQLAHQATAFAAATEMRTAFRDLRKRWTTLGYPGTDSLFVRIGLSCGLVTLAQVGHVHERRTTVIGPAVNAAADACQSKTRDRDIIVLTREVMEALPNELKVANVEVKTEKGDFYELG